MTDKPITRTVDNIKLAENGGKHGSCVSYYNFDELDQKSLEFAKQYSHLPVIDLGASQYLVQSLRFASNSIWVDAIDLLAPAVDVPDNIRFFKKDINKFDFNLLNKKYSLLYAQRVFDLLPFHDARHIIQNITPKLMENGRLYFSLASLSGGHGAHYNHKKKPMEGRFGKLDADHAKEHDLHTKVCLYNEEDIDRLIEGLALKKIEHFNSSYGTHKIILEKCK